MIMRTFTTVIASLLLLSLSTVAHAKITSVPEPFKDATAGSTYSIKYDDVNELLRKAVVNTGRSTREKAEPTRAKTGTRMKQTIKRATANEANRFYFEAFEGDDDATEFLHHVRKSLEIIPSQVPLGAFSRNEQLAYWLNLYNITLIDEIAKIYPKRNLKKVVSGKKSILDNQVLTVADIPLSLNDIEFILRENYNGDPLIIYGMFQGIIGGPNIRRVAYSGSNVYQALQDNAEEFVNSNRGTYAKDEKTFRVSSLYERDSAFFASDEALKKHLLSFVQSPELEELKSSSRIKRDIDDWTIVDLHGSSRDLGSSFADSKAALLDSFQGSQPDGSGGTVSTNFSAASSMIISNAPSDKRFSPDLMVRLQEINARRDQTAKGNATVTVEELGTVDVAPADSDKDDNQ